MHDRASLSRHFEMARRQKLNRFRTFFLAPEIVQRAEFWYAPVADIIQLVEPPMGVPMRIIRLILPYSLKWSGLAAKVRAVEQVWQHLMLEAGFACRVQVCFSKGGLPIWQLLRNRVHPCLFWLKALRDVDGR